MRKKLGYVGRATLNLIAVLIVVFGFQAAIRGRVPDALGLGLMLVVLIITYLAGVRWIERRQATELTAREGPREFGAGAALGLGLFTAVMLILWIARAYQPTGWGGFHGIASGFLFALMAAVLEEILFRGLLFRLLAKIFGTWGALAITSVLFGAAHAFNRGATVWSSFAIALEAGMLLGAAYAVTAAAVDADWTACGMELHRRLAFWHVGFGTLIDKGSGVGHAARLGIPNGRCVRPGGVDRGGGGLLRGGIHPHAAHTTAGTRRAAYLGEPSGNQRAFRSGGIGAQFCYPRRNGDGAQFRPHP